uniref:Tenascin Ca n=1 Tax=Myripristis murdjan TaxID=586833 RepID=A0A667XDE2_9TELE
RPSRSVCVCCLLLTAVLSLSSAGLVKKILRHRRQTLVSSGEDNITLPSPGQPVVFNHVYNINVPASAMCSVNLDAPDVQLEPKDAPALPGFHTTEHTADKENQIVFTHRINIPRQACGCADDLPELKALLSRLEMLEGELSTLREQCNGDANCCSSRGRCVNGQCVCEEGFAGEDCSVKTCPSNCYGRGECIDGRCVCYVGFSGEDCGELSCPSNCLNRGQCIDGQCVCDEGFTGEDCSQKACPNDCLGRGYCVDGKCVCQEGYSGDDCSVLACPDNCNNRGRCVNGRCACEEGYEGDNCVSPPTDLKVTDVTTETVDLSWSNEMLVTDYLVTYAPTSPGGLHQEITVPGDKMVATIKELEPGIEYMIHVYAILSNKRSVPVSARVATHLPQPEGLRFKSVRETSVEVEWDQLDISFDSWEIYFRNTVKENGKIVNTLPPYQNKFNQSGLGPGQEYEVSINIVKNNTRGPQASKKFTTKIGAPRQVEVKDVTESSALVTWSQPIAEVDGVTVFYWPTSDPSDRTSVDLSSADKQHSIGNLTPDTEYQVSLTSRRGGSTSEPVTDTFTTDLDAPRNLQTLSQTDDSITLQWSNSLADVDSYRVKYSSISGGPHGEEVFPRGPGDTTQATIPGEGLNPGTEYGVGVTAVKNERESLPATINAATDLDPPRDLRQSESTETTLTLEWQTPRAKITAYKLVYVSRDGRSEEVVIPATATTHVLTNLTPGMVYTVTLTAERGQRRSAPATLYASTGELLRPMVVNLTISDITWDSFNVSWSPKDGEFDSFVIEVTNLEHIAESQNLTLSGDAYSLGISGLNPNTSYMVALYGMHQGSFLDPVYTDATTGTCHWQRYSVLSSNSVRFVSPLTRSDTAVSSYYIEFTQFLLRLMRSSCWWSPALDKPQGLTAVNVTDTSALLLWQPSVATVDGYVITYSGSSGVFLIMVGPCVSDVDPPRDLAASNIQTDSATVTWKPPRAAVTGYTLTFSSADATVREVVLSPTATSYSMSDLTGSTEYTVRLQAIVGPQKSRPVSTIFSTIGKLYRHPKDCAQALLNGETTSGLYTIYLEGEESQPIQVYCDMTTDGGGWMVFLRRQNGKLEFFRNWKNYTAGFGNMNDEFWLGLSNLHKITSSGQYELRVDLRDNGETAYAQYDKFSVAEPRTRYKVYIGGYSGTAGDSMTYHQGRPFSTYDNDNDIAVTNCALSYKGAFWYKNCHRVNLMGKYGDNSHSKGINWFHWKGHEHSIEYAEMKIRPANFRNFESRRKRS